jgi:type IX secretion system PorP/SprF family membrane protein
MMNKSTYHFLGFAFLLLTLTSAAQDVHFTQFTNTPMLTNVAQTGDINGEFRVGYLYRNQWNSISSPYVTSCLFADKKFMEEKLKGDFVGGGIQIIADNSADGAIKTTHFSLNAAYHHYLNKNLDRKVYGGLQLGAFQKSINPNVLVFENQFNYSASDFSGTSNGENFSTQSIVRPDVQLGAGYWMSTKKYYINCGLSAAHINRPNQSLSTQKDMLATKWVLHGDGQYNISKFLFVTPSVLVMYQKRATEFNVGGVLNYGFGKKLKENIYLKTGVWYRVGDAFNFLFGINHNNWQFNFTYDVNASKLHVASNYQGALEISMIYTHNLFNIQKNKTRIVPANRLF